MTAEDLVSPGGDPDAGRAGRGVTPPIVVRAQGATKTLRPGPAYRIGRDPSSDIVVEEPLVSWQHATLKVAEGRWFIEDAGSTNGTFADKTRVRQIAITDSCQIRLGHPEAGPVLSCKVAYTPGPDATAVHSATALWTPAGMRAPTGITRLPAKVLRIGRSDDNDVVVPDLRVSRHHAELRKSPGGAYEITDLDSHNGTFVNGQRMESSVLTEADVIGVGPATFRLVGDELQQFDDTGDVSLDALGLTVTLSSGKILLNDVSFPLPERCLLGVIGPSGAGKSTLLGALTGMRPATTGTVLYDGRDLYANYAELRHRIGLVPQENILHAQLSARRALGFAAELRFPRDTSAAERSRRIDEVIGELSLTQHAETRTSSLSGGQQKRVNVALELLTKPSLLFLDEPTSGLDPGLDKSVMEMMSALAKEGRTVIVVTHSVANLGICDRLLVLVPGGKIAYFGSPADGLHHFGLGGWAEVFQAFEAEPDRDWAGDYRNSVYYARYTSGPRELMAASQAAAQPAQPLALATPTEPAAPATVPPKLPPPPKSANRFAQLSTLVRRYVAVIASDRNYVAAIALLPIILGGLIRGIPDAGGLTGPNNGLAIQLLMILVMSACLIGIANAVRELVKERPIYTRERAAGLSPGAYLLSKLIVLGVISAVQAVVLVAIGLAGRKLPPHGVVLTSAPLIEIMLAMALLAIASMTIGLLISAVVNSSDKTMPLLVVAVLVEVVLSGGIIRLNNLTGLEQLSWLSPSRWGFAAAAATVDLNNVTPPPPGNTPDPLWNHTPHVWFLDMGVLLALAVVFASFTWWRLRQASPGRR
jgi:ABC-type multidrug transport system ATPase subunit/pSer/pThr/pTyr-binding forkhead associated (FHA) protein